MAEKQVISKVEDFFYIFASWAFKNLRHNVIAEEFINQIVFEYIYKCYYSSLNRIPVSEYCKDYEKAEIFNGKDKDINADTLSKAFTRKVKAIESNPGFVKRIENSFNMTPPEYIKIVRPKTGKGKQPDENNRNKIFWHYLRIIQEMNSFLKSQVSGRINSEELVYPKRFKYLFGLYEKCINELKAFSTKDKEKNEDKSKDENARNRNFIESSLIFFNIEWFQSVEAIYSLILRMEELGIQEISEEAALVFADAILNPDDPNIEIHNCFAYYRNKYIDIVLAPEFMQEDLYPIIYRDILYLLIKRDDIRDYIEENYIIDFTDISEMAQFIKEKYNILSLYKPDKDWTDSRIELFRQINNYIFPFNYQKYMQERKDRKNSPNG